ncbi:MAG TPA: polyamine aminopropyltransferase [Devosiaceae bacterium]
MTPPPIAPRRRRFFETLHKDVGFHFDADEVLFEERTEHQDMVLFANSRFGKVLMLDGATQVTTADEFIYHEMMAHVPILAHGAARRVLIVGGGDCGIAEEVLKHKGIERLVQVEIDAAVLDFAREHFAEFNAPVFEDERFVSVIADGMAYVRETSERFDVIIVDSTDPLGPGEVLFGEPFYAACRKLLNRRGVMVSQNGVPFMQPQELATAMSALRASFEDVWAYVAAIPTYVGGHMAMGFSATGADLRVHSIETIAARFETASIDTRYYTPAVHVAAFALPRYIEQIVGGN